MSEEIEDYDGLKQTSVKSTIKKKQKNDSMSSPLVESELGYDNRSSNAAMVVEEERTSKKKKALTWDEHAIEEHDLLRGTRMKIDEPNTPFTYYEHQSDDDSAKTAESANNTNNLTMNWERLENKLDAVAAAQDLYPSSPSGSSMGATSADSDNGSIKGSDGVESKRALRKATEFGILRKKHYNEMEALKTWRAKHSNDDDDDDDDEDDDNDNDKCGNGMQV